MLSDHTMPKVDIHVIGGRADFDAVASMTTAGSTSRSMSTSSSDTSLLASAASPSVANSVCMNLLVVAKEKQALAKARLRAAADTEQLVADLEQTIRIHAHAKKHARNIKNVLKSRRAMADSLAEHQEMFVETMDSTEEYFRKQKEVESANRDVRDAQKRLKVEVLGPLPRVIHAESDSSSSTTT
jgi:hypothetical protein